MRELKFRVWDGEKFLRSSFGKKDKEFISLKLEGGILPQYGGRMNYHMDMVVQQYTGLKDKNGKEIYEGDIVKIYSHNQPEEVLYVADGSTAFGFFKHNSPERTDGSFESLGDYTGPNGYEIIGNIFQNSELLKE